MSQHLERRREEILRLYIKGLTYNEIAEELGLGYQVVYLAVKRQMRESFRPSSDIEQWRAEKLAQLEILIDRMWQSADDPKVAGTIIRAIEKQADLIGLARFKIAAETTITLDQVRQYKERLEEMREQLVNGEVVSGEVIPGLDTAGLLDTPDRQDQQETG